MMRDHLFTSETGSTKFLSDISKKLYEILQISILKLEFEVQRIQTGGGLKKKTPQISLNQLSNLLYSTIYLWLAPREYS